MVMGRPLAYARKASRYGSRPPRIPGSSGASRATTSARLAARARACTRMRSRSNPSGTGVPATRADSSAACPSATRVRAAPMPPRNPGSAAASDAVPGTPTPAVAGPAFVGPAFVGPAFVGPAVTTARIAVSSSASSCSGGKSSSRSSRTPGGSTRERSSASRSSTTGGTGCACVSCQTPPRSTPPATCTYASASSGIPSRTAAGSSPRLTRLVCRLATSISSRTPVRSTSSVRNCPSVSSSPGHENSAAMFSRASGTGRASCAIRTFSHSTSSASRVRGTGSRCPASSTGEEVRTKAMCSVTSGAPSATARSASAASFSGSGRSAPPSPSETPCGTTRVPRSRSRSSDSGRWPGHTFSATTSTQSRPGSRSTASAISGRQPMPTPRCAMGFMSPRPLSSHRVPMS